MENPLSETSTNPPEKPSKKPQGPPKPLVFAIAAALIGAGYFAWQHFLPEATADRLSLSGRIEADETEIGAKTGGRLVAIKVREGDSVTQGQLVAEIVDEEVPEQIRAAAAQVTAAQQEEQQVKSEIDVAESRIREAEVNLQQSQGDTIGRVDQADSLVAVAAGRVAEAQAQVAQAKSQVVQAKSQVAQAKSQVVQAKSQLKLAQRNRDRYAELFAKGAINQQQLDQAQTTLETAQASLDNAIAAVETAAAGVETAEATVQAREAGVDAAVDQRAAAAGGLTQTKTSAFNPAIRSSQLTALQQQKQQAYAKLAGAQAKVKNATAAQNQLQKRLESFQIKSPIDGVVQSRPLEPGAVVATGKTLLTLISPTTTYLRGYIPEGDIGKIHVGMKAEVFIDANAKQPIPATVTAIDPKASFTPENIYFKKDRVRQVFGVKIAIDQSQGFAKPGMPADAEILLK
jgi:HlyD family secretion protein